MPIGYNPTPKETTSITKPVDGETKPVASINVALEGLADWIAFLKFGPPGWTGAIANAGAKVFERGVWHDMEQTWYAVGLSGVQTVFQRSQDGGRSWVDISAAIAAVSTLDIACKQSTGDLVIICQGVRNVLKGTLPAGAAFYGWASTGGNWGNQANATSANVTAGNVVFESTAGKYVVVYRTTTLGMRVDWDADGTGAFTAGTLPAGWAGYANATQDPTLNCIAGRCMALFFDDTGGTNLYRIATSTDGGNTWSGVTKAPATFNPATTTKAVYNPNVGAQGTWIFCGAATGPRKTEVFNSTDHGATWTSVLNSTAVTADMALQDIEFKDGRLYGVNDDGRIFASDDNGATWKQYTRNPVSVSARIYLRSGGGQLQMWHSTDKTSFTTLRFGGFGQVVA